MTATLEAGDRAQLACILEATARKPGNVHPGRSFRDAGYLDFVVSASILGRNLRPELLRDRGVGPSILRAARETRATIGHNANLGMILLLTPLAAAPEGVPLREGIAEVLHGLTINDAEAAFEAIRIAKPGGLGSSPEQDVATAPTVTLREAMRLAADRDAIARQYATDFDDVFELAAPTLRDALGAGRPLEIAIVQTQLMLMAAHPDTLIARKRGPALALESSRRALGVIEAGWPDRPSSVAAIRDFDAWLRRDGHSRNPGATADLLAATLYVALGDGTIEVPRHLNRPGWDAGDSL